jgi:hypothetical protein
MKTRIFHVEALNRTRGSAYHKRYRRVQDAITLMTRYRVLAAAGYSLGAAAWKLGISRTQLHRLKEACSHLAPRQWTETKLHAVLNEFYPSNFHK